MKVSIKNREILNIYAILQEYGNSTDPWFTHGAFQNMQSLEPAIKSIEAAKRSSEEFILYENKRMELVKKHAKRDSNGQPIFQRVPISATEYNDIYEIEDPEGLEKDVKELLEQDDNQGVVNRNEEHKKRYQSLLNASSEVKVFEMRMSDAPKGLVKGNHMKLLIPAKILKFDLKREED